MPNRRHSYDNRRLHSYNSYQQPSSSQYYQQPLQQRNVYSTVQAQPKQYGQQYGSFTASGYGYDAHNTSGHNTSLNTSVTSVNASFDSGSQKDDGRVKKLPSYPMRTAPSSMARQQPQPRVAAPPANRQQTPQQFAMPSARPAAPAAPAPAPARPALAPAPTPVARAPAPSSARAPARPAPAAAPPPANRAPAPSRSPVRAAAAEPVPARAPSPVKEAGPVEPAPVPVTAPEYFYHPPVPEGAPPQRRNSFGSTGQQQQGGFPGGQQFDGGGYTRPGEGLPGIGSAPPPVPPQYVYMMAMQKARKERIYSVLSRKGTPPPRSETDVEAIRRSAAAPIKEMVSGFMGAQVLYGAARLKLFDSFSMATWASWNSILNMKEFYSLGPDALYRMLRAVSSIGLMVESESHSFKLTPSGEAMQSYHPDSMWHLVMTSMAPSAMATWNALPLSMEHSNKNNPAFFLANDASLFCYYSKDENAKERRNYHQTQHADTLVNVAPSLLSVYDFGELSGKVVDVGGGRGALVETLLGANDNISGVVLDKPSAVRGATLSTPELTARCKFQGGNFLKKIPRGSTFLLKSVLSNWNNATCVKILENCAESFQNEKSRILVIDQMIPDRQEGRPPSRSRKPIENEFLEAEQIPLPSCPPSLGVGDVEMLAFTKGGRIRTIAEMAKLLESAGLELRRRPVLIPNTNSFYLIECRRLQSHARFGADVSVQVSFYDPDGAPDADGLGDSMMGGASMILNNSDQYDYADTDKEN